MCGGTVPNPIRMPSVRWHGEQAGLAEYLVDASERALPTTMVRRSGLPVAVRGRFLAQGPGCPGSGKDAMSATAAPGPQG